MYSGEILIKKRNGNVYACISIDLKVDMFSGEILIRIHVILINMRVIMIHVHVTYTCDVDSSRCDVDVYMIHITRMR